MYAVRARGVENADGQEYAARAFGRARPVRADDAAQGQGRMIRSTTRPAIR